MSKKMVGKVLKTNEQETNGGKRFGIWIENDDGDKNWVNGWGSVPDGVVKGAKVQVPYELDEYNGNLSRKVADKDAIDILEEGSGNSNSGSSNYNSGGGSSKNYDRQNAIKTAGTVFEGAGPMSGEELQQFKMLVEELNHFNETGEWDELPKRIADMLSYQDDNEHPGGGNAEAEEAEDVSEISESEEEQEPEETPEPEPEPEEDEAQEEPDEEPEPEADSDETEDLQEEMKKAAEENSEGEDVIFGEDEEEGEEETLFGDEDEEEDTE